MSRYDLSKMEKKLQKDIDTARYRHTIGVMYTASSLAMCYGADIESAMTAGLLHDCAKCIPNDKKIRLCEKYEIPISKAEKDAPYLLHAKLGAEIARRKYEVDDMDILSAIRYHTTGRADMSLLEKIIYLADYIEPGRYKAENLPEIRQIAFTDIDQAIYMTMRDTLSYLKRDPEKIDATTQEAYDFYKALVEG